MKSNKQAVDERASKARANAEASSKELEKQRSANEANENKEKDLKLFMDRMQTAIDKATAELAAL